MPVTMALGMAYWPALTAILTAQAVSALYLHSLSKTSRPGLPRLALALPALAINFISPLLFERVKNETTIVLIAFNTWWLTR